MEGTCVGIFRAETLKSLVIACGVIPKNAKLDSRNFEFSNPCLIIFQKFSPSSLLVEKFVVSKNVGKDLVFLLVQGICDVAVLLHVIKA